MNRYIYDFIKYLEVERNYSPNTFSAYTNDLFIFYEIIKDLPTYNRENLEGWFEQSTLYYFLTKMHEKKYKPTSINRAIAAIKSFYRYLRRTDLLPDTTELVLDNIPNGFYLPEILSKEEIDTILGCIDINTPIGARDYSIIEMLYASGIRVSELCGLNHYDVRDGFIKVTGKGRKERIVPIHKGIPISIVRYKDLFTKKIKIKDKKAVYLSNKGMRITRYTVWTIVKHYVREAKITKKISPHSFRHSLATHLIENGADIRIVQEILGHEGIGTTDLYLHLNMKEVTEKFEKFHPRP